MRKLKLTIGKVEIEAELFDTPTADALFAAAPFEARAVHWGEELYFTVPLRLEREEGARAVVAPGELAFRVEGEAVVIGYGPTPNSEDREIRLAMPSNVWGVTGADVRQLRRVEPGELIRVEPLAS